MAISRICMFFVGVPSRHSYLELLLPCGTRLIVGQCEDLMSGQGGVMERLQRLDEGPSHCGGEWVMVDTLPETNISPENGWLED